MSRTRMVLAVVLSGMAGGCASDNATQPDHATAPAALNTQASRPARGEPLAPIAQEDRSRVDKQLNRLFAPGVDFHEHYPEVAMDWKTAVEELIASGRIRNGSSRAEIVALLGPPYDEYTGDGVSSCNWYFATRMHVNPCFHVEFRDDAAMSFKFYRR